MPDPIDVARLRGLAPAIDCPLPWRVVQEGIFSFAIFAANGACVASRMWFNENAEFIVAAVNALPALLDEREALRAALKEIEWMVDPRDRSDEPRWCPACDQYEAAGHARNGHAEGCSIDAALARTGETT